MADYHLIDKKSPLYIGNSEETERIRNDAPYPLYREIKRKEGKPALEEIAELTKNFADEDRIMDKLKAENKVSITTYMHEFGNIRNIAYFVAYGDEPAKKIEEAAEKGKRSFSAASNPPREYRVLKINLINFDKYIEKKTMPHPPLKNLRENYGIKKLKSNKTEKIPSKVVFVIDYDTEKEEFIFGTLKQGKVSRFKESDDPCFICRLSSKDTLFVVNSVLDRTKYDNIPVWKAYLGQTGGVQEYEFKPLEKPKTRREIKKENKKKQTMLHTRPVKR